MAGDGDKPEAEAFARSSSHTCIHGQGKGWREDFENGMEPNNVNILTYQNLNLINPGFESVLSTKNPLTVV